MVWEMPPPGPGKKTGSGNFSERKAVTLLVNCQVYMTNAGCYVYSCFEFEEKTVLFHPIFVISSEERFQCLGHAVFP
eukprot:3031370-Amphidinium_carterae.1